MQSCNSCVPSNINEFKCTLLRSLGSCQFPCKVRMDCLATELVDNGFPFRRSRADAVAAVLNSEGFSCIKVVGPFSKCLYELCACPYEFKDLKNAGHVLPSRRSCARLPTEELQWIVNMAVQITKGGPMYTRAV